MLNYTVNIVQTHCCMCQMESSGFPQFYRGCQTDRGEDLGFFYFLVSQLTLCEKKKKIPCGNIPCGIFPLCPSAVLPGVPFYTSRIRLQYSCLENPREGGAWWATVHGVAESQTRLNDFTFTFHFDALEKEMATHSSVLAWRIPGTGQPGGLPSVGSHRVRHN